MTRRKVIIPLCFAVFALVFFNSAAIGQITNESDRYAVRGKRLYEQKRYALAIQSFQKALEGRKTNGMAAYFLAMSYRKDRNIKSAVECLEEYFKALAASKEPLSEWDTQFVPQNKKLLDFLKQQGASK